MTKIKEDYLILFCILFVLVVILARYKIFNDDIVEGYFMHASSGGNNNSSGDGSSNNGSGSGCTIC
jgi:hypothetical protein